MCRKKSLCSIWGIRHNAPTVKNCSARVGEHFEEQLKAGESLLRGQGDKLNDLDVKGDPMLPKGSQRRSSEHVDKRVDKIVEDVNSSQIYNICHRLCFMKFRK